MKNLRTDSIIVGILLVAAAGVWFATSGNSTIDIQLHDSYFVFDKSLLIALIFGPLAFLIFLFRALAQRLKNISTNILLAIALVIVSIITYHIIQVQKDYAKELLTVDGIDASVKEKVVHGVQRGILWSWCIFGVWCVAFVLLSLRTARMWRS
jgi:uncharacterized membrane protein